MGIIADTAAEVVERTRNTMEGAVTDLTWADIVHIATDATGKVWVNVDGVLLLRVQHVDLVTVDTSETPTAVVTTAP